MDIYLPLLFYLIPLNSFMKRQNGCDKNCSSALDLRSLFLLGSVHKNCHSFFDPYSHCSRFISASNVCFFQGLSIKTVIHFLTRITTALFLSLLQMYLVLLKFFFSINFLRTRPKQFFLVNIVYGKPLYLYNFCFSFFPRSAQYGCNDRELSNREVQNHMSFTFSN